MNSASESQGARADWPAELHRLWLAAQEVEDVQDMSAHLYGLVLEQPGVVAVTGTRWQGGRLSYLRRTERHDPVLHTDSSCTRTDPGRPAPDPGGPEGLHGPALHAHDLSDESADGFSPERETLLRAGARYAWESRFALGGDDWAALSVGLGDASDTTPELLNRLTQLSEVLLASNRRILGLRAHERRQMEDALLAEASLQMDTSLDVRETLARVSRLAVPAVAEGCAVHLFNERGLLEPAASVHVAAAEQPWLAELARHDAWLADRCQEAADRGSGVVLLAEDLEGAPFGPHRADEGRAVRAVSVNPLRARGKSLGTLTFVYHREGEAVASRRLLDDLARRAALAIDTTMAYEQRRHHVQQLQRHLLPDSLPEWPAAELGAVYEVADSSLEVGGDFYDAVVDRDGCLAVMIGDVCGRGAEAAALTGLARHTLRTLLEDGTAPAEALQRLNTVLMGQSTTRFITAAVAVFCAGPDGTQLARVAAAGHPPPLVRRADGRTEEAAVSGLLLGVEPRIEPGTVELTLTSGDCVVLFTDGLTEARSEDGVMFEEWLPEVLGECNQPAPDRAAELVARMSKFRATGDDDTAVLVTLVK
ncbi:SpoIIE family protein phosphatase [Streptomyces sp. XM4193]|uniref:PP2C family protein-serine/threonine phosphatase n=1 Tax=Streptomyces sp. XM4193 TaxID=2929782 RepID=UPI001FF9EBB8|nr:GAF domain-containing SpoIIE family protein phosphatase [Streptomyces sp. XM4193]MCK1795633.1 SpoIIE family protein phosphatase [Streptomyces sp. XM4193]